MSTHTVIQNAFNAGALDPLMHGRTDVQKYVAGLAECTNFVPLKQGPLVRRPGFRFVKKADGSVAIASSKNTLFPFLFSQTQAYAMAFSDNAFKVMIDRTLDHGGVTTLTESELVGRQYAQHGDLLLLPSKNSLPYCLLRTGTSSWNTFDMVYGNARFELKDGPYQAENTTATTLTWASTNRVTASSTTGINNDAGFLAADIGRCIRLINDAGNGWYWCAITAIVSTTVVDVGPLYNVGPTGSAITGARTRWRLGYYSATSGPACVAFHEHRMWMLGGVDSPDLISASVIGDFLNFSPTAQGTDTVTDDSGLVRRLGTQGADEILWARSATGGLLIGTVSSEWVARTSLDQGAVTPTAIKLDRLSSIGSANANVVYSEGRVIFIGQSTRGIYEVGTTPSAEGTYAIELTTLAAHLCKAGIRKLALQQAPFGILWALLEDGTLVSTTYSPQHSVAALAAQPLSESPNGLGFKYAVEDILCIPNASAKQDDLWIIAQRSSTRHAAHLESFATEESSIQDSFYVDMGATYDGAPATIISGLEHLEGHVVRVLTDGASHPDRVVSSGAITLAYSASKVQVGLGYRSHMQTLPVEVPTGTGTAQFKIKRIHRLWLRLLNTVGLRAGRDVTHVEELVFRDTNDALTAAVPLFTGDKVASFEDAYNSAGVVYVEKDDALPATILALGAQLEVADA
ncbi:MAG: hypothetical protein C4542_06090 [Dehalococcoidia bacterium]|nr:MAG: hypothetical protein C4542_06090 [Dehalococcoidia bacterium]